MSYAIIRNTKYKRENLKMINLKKRGKYVKIKEKEGLKYEPKRISRCHKEQYES